MAGTKAPINMERIVRPFVKSAPRPERGRTPVDADEGEATITWSARVALEATTMEGWGIKMVVGKDLNDREELERVTRVQRITNPEDENQYVDVEVIDDITFRDPSGQRHKYTLKNQ